MTKRIDPTIEVKQVKKGNFGPLFDGKDISEAELMGGEQPENEKKAMPEVQESKDDETVAPLGAQPNPLFEDRRCDCCGREIRELKFFGGPGDSLAGDFIEGAGIAETAEEIQMFTTQRVTPDNKTIIVPNAKMKEDNITNSNAKGTRLVELVFRFGYVYDIDYGCQVIEEVLSQDDRVLAKPAPMGVVSELANGSLNFEVPVWTSADDYWRFYHDITEEVKTRFDAEGISVPVPQHLVHRNRQKE
jgi:hypothetical protein